MRGRAAWVLAAALVWPTGFAWAGSSDRAHRAAGASAHAMPTGTGRGYERRRRDRAGQVAKTASHARTLKEAIAAFESLEGTVPVTGSRAVAPVMGVVVQRYGQATEGGTASGVTYAPPPASAVGAPCGGRIEFAGPFRSYGKMVIVDCGRSRRFVLAGLDRIAVTPGVIVRSGETVGRMAGAGGRARLYVQERRGLATVDPSDSRPR